MPVKVTVNLPVETVNTLREMAAARRTTITEVLKQVIESQAYLEDEIRRGRQLLLQNPVDNTIQRLAFYTTARPSAQTK
jgi:hypothetical protein